VAVFAAEATGALLVQAFDEGAAGKSFFVGYDAYSVAEDDFQEGGVLVRVLT
jgi:hypothetical protein